ncbi:hypothetical protein EYF80_053839 [Liparis tanakae]|uniref:Uncharacterized protein n=1 Tax=Liparis tanakae TaxID=230148 RepID=A0A4Z2F565_9TELE|nr:hypothetical protein EYF80_053839 [Liparis tanakae]
MVPVQPQRASLAPPLEQKEQQWNDPSLRSSTAASTALEDDAIGGGRRHRRRTTSSEEDDTSREYPPVLGLLVDDGDQDGLSAALHPLPGRVPAHQGEVAPLALNAPPYTCRQQQGSEVRGQRSGGRGHLTLTFPFDGAPAEVQRRGVDHADQRVSVHLARRLAGHEADAGAGVVGGGARRASVVARLQQAGQPPQRHSFGGEDLGVGAAAQQPLGELHAAADVQQRLLQLRPLQVELALQQRAAVGLHSAGVRPGKRPHLIGRRVHAGLQSILGNVHLRSMRGLRLAATTSRMRPPWRSAASRAGRQPWSRCSVAAHSRQTGRSHGGQKRRSSWPGCSEQRIGRRRRPHDFSSSRRCTEWHAKPHRLTQHTSQRLSAPPSPHRSQPRGPPARRASRNTWSRARWSVLRPAGPDAGRSTSESQWGQSTVTPARCPSTASPLPPLPPLPPRSGPSRPRAHTEKGSSRPMQSEQKVCRHGRIFGSRYTRLQPPHTALRFTGAPVRCPEVNFDSSASSLRDIVGVFLETSGNTRDPRTRPDRQEEALTGSS